MSTDVREVIDSQVRFWDIVAFSCPWLPGQPAPLDVADRAAVMRGNPPKPYRMTDETASRSEV